MKLNEIKNPHAKIEALLKKYKIENYTIRPDGTVDVDGNVNLSAQNFALLPFKFGKVAGFFTCSYCPLLTSLRGAPCSVAGIFNCNSCASLTSLEGAPVAVGADFNCHGCPSVTSLEGFGSHVSRIMCCEWPHIKSGGISLVLSGSTQLFRAEGPFLIIEKYLKRPDDIFECQAELIAAGYDDFAIL